MPVLSQIWFHPKFYRNLPSIWSRPSVMQLMQMMLTQTSGRWLIYIPFPSIAAACSTSHRMFLPSAADLQMFSTQKRFLGWFSPTDVSSADFHSRMFPRLILTHGCFLGHPRMFPRLILTHRCFLGHPRMFPQLPPAPDVSYQHIMSTGFPDDCRFTFPIAGNIRYLHQKRFSIHTIWQLPPASIQWMWEKGGLSSGFHQTFLLSFFLRL